MIKKILTVAAVLGAVMMFSSCDKDSEKDVTILAKDEVNVSALAGKIVTVSFDSGISFAGDPATVSVANGTKIKLDAPVVKEDDELAKLFEFKGWAESSDGEVKYKVGEELEVAGNTVLYAVWALKPVNPLEGEGGLVSIVSNYIQTAHDVLGDKPILLTMADTTLADDNKNEYLKNILAAISNNEDARVILDISKTNLDVIDDNLVEDVSVDLAGIILPETATSVNLSSSTFQNLTLPKYVTSLVVCNNAELKSIVIDGFQLSKVRLEDCAKLENINFSNSVNIDVLTLGYLPSLKTLDLTNVYSIANVDIHNLNTLSSLTFVDKFVDDCDFNISECESLESLSLPERVHNISIKRMYGLKKIIAPYVSFNITDCPELSSVELRYSGSLPTEEIDMNLLDNEKPFAHYDAEKEEYVKHDFHISFIKDGKKVDKMSVFTDDGVSEIFSNKWIKAIGQLSKFLPQVKDQKTGELRNQTFEEITGIKDDVSDGN